MSSTRRSNVFALLGTLVVLSACGSGKQLINYDPPKQAPLNGTLTLNVADSAMQGDEPQLALTVTQAILAKNPDDAAAWQKQGDAYFALGKITDAENSYKKALSSLSATSVSSGSGIGGLPLITNSFSGNRREVIEAVKLGLGRIELGQDPAAAEARFADVVANDPTNTRALNNLGIARDRIGKHDLAQEAYRKVLAIAPDDAAAKVNLGLSLALSGNADEAIDMLRPLATSSGATPRIRQDYAVALAMAGHTADAEKVLQADMSAEQAAAAVAGYRELPNTTPAPVKVN